MKIEIIIEDSDKELYKDFLDFNIGQARGRRSQRRGDPGTPVGHPGLLHAEGADRGKGIDACVDAKLPGQA